MLKLCCWRNQMVLSSFSVGSTLAGAPPHQVIVQTQMPPPHHTVPHLGPPHLISTNPPPASSPQPLMTTVQPELVPASLPVWGSSAPAGIPTQQIIQQVRPLGWIADQIHIYFHVDRKSFVLWRNIWFFFSVLICKLLLHTRVYGFNYLDFPFLTCILTWCLSL